MDKKKINFALALIIIAVLICYSIASLESGAFLSALDSGLLLLLFSLNFLFFVSITIKLQYSKKRPTEKTPV